MRPSNLNSKIFLDSGDPTETKSILDKLGFLDGQTTNPSLVAKNPEVIAEATDGIKLSKTELSSEYQKIVREVSQLLPTGSVSIEVYADMQSSTEQLLAEAIQMNTWIPNAHIKFPVTKAGLEAANLAIKEGIRVNMTLVFSQAQAAAVYAATKGAYKGQVFLSPFIGRLDDIGLNGMDLITNIQKLYQTGDGHVQILAASLRSQDHLAACLKSKVDIMTVPFKILTEWNQQIDPNFQYQPDLASIEMQSIDLNQDWQTYNLEHELTTKGIEKFVADWKNLLI